MLDIPLVYEPDDNFTQDSMALISDWRALTAMRIHALEQIATIKTLL